MLRGVEPMATWYTPTAWTAYILLADAAVYAVSGHSRLHDAPGEFLLLWVLSVPLWLVFEAYNLRLENWVYVGLPPQGPARWFGYIWSFATITPGIFETADLVAVLGWFRKTSKPLHFSSWTKQAMEISGRSAIDSAAGGAAAHRDVYVRAGVARIYFSAGPHQSFGRIAVADWRFRGRASRPFLFAAGKRLDLRLAVGIVELPGGCEVALRFSPDAALEDF